MAQKDTDNYIHVIRMVKGGIHVYCYKNRLLIINVTDSLLCMYSTGMHILWRRGILYVYPIRNYLLGHILLC